MIMYDFGKGEVAAHQHPNGGGWVAETARVDDSCFIGPYATVFDHAVIKDNVRIDNYARVYDNALVCQTSKIYGDAQVCGNANVMNNARVSGRAKIYENAKVYDNSHIYDNVQIYGNAIVRNFSEVYENAKVHGEAKLLDSIKIYNDCIVTRQPMTLSGKISDSASHITFTDNMIAIGCIVLPPSLFNKYAMEIFSRFKRFFMLTEYEAENWIKIINYVSDFHGCKDHEEDIQRIDQNKVIQRILMGETQDRNINKGLF